VSEGFFGFVRENWRGGVRERDGSTLVTRRTKKLGKTTRKSGTRDKMAKEKVVVLADFTKGG